MVGGPSHVDAPPQLPVPEFAVSHSSSKFTAEDFSDTERLGGGGGGGGGDSSSDGGGVACSSIHQWADLHRQAHGVVWGDVLEPLLGGTGQGTSTHGSSNAANTANAAATASIDLAGCVVSRPGSSDQQFHQDGSTPGFFNVFIPLVDVTAELGPTEFVPGTHRQGGASGGGFFDLLGAGASAASVSPECAAGDLLIFDYRVRHRGVGNRSRGPGATRPVAYLTCV